MITAIAWVGEDELGNGEIGIKRASGGALGAECHWCHALQPMALCMLEGQRNARVLQLPALVKNMQWMANRYRKTIRLVRFVEAETLITITPKETMQ